MAELSISVGSTTLSLSDGSPFLLESLTDASSAPVVRHEQGAPLENSVLDLGYRLQPRELHLTLLFAASTPAALDTRRQTLMDAFKPLTSEVIHLFYERDDAEIRQLECFTVGEIVIGISPMEYAAKMHSATITLRAADPLWVNPALTQGSYTGSTAQVWWTAGGVIHPSNVMEHTEWPTQGQAWTYTGTITASYTIAIRTARPTEAGTIAAFHAGTAALQAASNTDAKFYFAGAGYWIPGNGAAVGVDIGTTNYMMVSSNSSNVIMYNGWSNQIGNSAINSDITGTARRWRSDRLGSASTYWPVELPKVAVYNYPLDENERIELDRWMQDTGILGTISAVNQGDVYEYPYITIQGPLRNPKLTNVTTGDVLDLTGVVLGSADTYTIDLRTGDKLVYDQNGVNRITDIVDTFTLANFALAPAPVATGGTNFIRVQGGSVSTNTLVTVNHYQRYMSF